MAAVSPVVAGAVVMELTNRFCSPPGRRSLTGTWNCDGKRSGVKVNAVGELGARGV